MYKLCYSGNDESFSFLEEDVLAFSNCPLPEFPISTDLLLKNLGLAIITSMDGDVSRYYSLLTD